MTRQKAWHQQHQQQHTTIVNSSTTATVGSRSRRVRALSCTGARPGVGEDGAGVGEEAIILLVVHAGRCDGLDLLAIA